MLYSYHCVGPDTALRHGDDYNGLYAVNPMNQINQYSEVANQYAEVGLKGQERSRAAELYGVVTLEDPVSCL